MKGASGPRRARLARRGRATLGWALVAFAAAQLGLAVAMECWRPVLFDVEYGYKLSRLRERRGDEPGRPLLLVLGSSRIGQGLRPETLPASWAGCEPPPVVYNFGLTGAGNLTELLCLYRLLAEGIRPDWLVVEVMPLLLHQEDAATAYEENWWFTCERVQVRDLLRLWPYTIQTGQVYGHCLRARLTPWFAHRFCIVSYYAPFWLTDNARLNGWERVDRSGWLGYGPLLYDPVQYAAGLERARLSYQGAFEHFRVSDIPNRALREMLTVCRDKGIRTALLLMPESSAVRGWYRPEARAEINHYLQALSQEYAVPLVDATGWASDDSFSDGHHLLPSPAAAFTERLAREALRPLLHGYHPDKQQPPGAVVLRDPARTR